MQRLLRSLAQNQRLLKDFVVRDLKARYVGSSMGFFWSVVFPIINLFVYMFVFRLILKARWSDSQGPLEVALVMLAGIVVWAAFAETVSRATNSLVENSNLIQKVVFPSELLPFYLTISSLINMMIGLPVVVLCVAFFAYVMPPDVHVLVEQTDGTVLVEDDEGEMVEVPGKVPLELVMPEGGVEDGAVAMLVPFRLSRGLDRDITFRIEFDGTAQAGVDYPEPPRELTIPSGQLRIDIFIQPLRDLDDGEGEETVIVRLVEATNANVMSPGDVDQLMARERILHIVDGPAGEGAPVEPMPPVLADRDLNYHPLQLGWSLLFLPVLFFLQTFFTAGLGCFLATLNLFLRDTFHLVGVAITVWMFSTPIFYPGDMVVRAGYGFILQVNPMHWLIESYRQVLLFSQWPDPVLVIKFAGAALLMFFLGGKFFMAQKSKFPDLL